MTKEKISLVIATLALVVALGVAIFKGEEVRLSDSQLEKLAGKVAELTLGGGTRFPNGLSTDSTSPLAGQTRTTTLLSTGTSTMTESIDGMMIGGVIDFTATGTPVTVYTNTTGPKYCDASNGYFIERNRGVFVPGHEWGFGTSTASGASSINLVASSTVFATTTPGTAVDYVIQLVGSKFILADGEKLMANVDAKISNLRASSTSFTTSSFQAEAQVWCIDLSI